MKIFKRIYYPTMAALLILMLILSFVNATVGNKNNSLGAEFIQDVRTHLDSIAALSRNSIYASSHEDVIDYIATNQLGTAAGISLGGDYEEEEQTIYTYSTADGKPIATYVLQRDTISEETLKYIDEENRAEGTAVWEVDKELTNIVVYIPGRVTIDNYATAGKATGDVVMMMAHYDSRIEGSGASDNGTQVAAMLQNIINITENNLKFDNDLLFVFTDAEEEGMYGAYMLKHQFVGFDDAFSRVKLGTNFDALGNKGSLVMFQSSDNNYSLISKYGKINGNTFTSSIANFVYGGMSNYTDFNIYGDIASLNFANVGGQSVFHTKNDNLQNVQDSTIIQHANMMNSVISTFGDYDLDNLESSQNAVFFSYLDAFTIVYSYIASYVLGAIAILLLLGVVVLNIKKKVFSFAKTGGGAVVQLLSIIASTIVLFALYYIFAALTSAMGIIPIRAIGSIVYESVGLVVSFMLLSLVASSFFTIVFKKIINVKLADIVRGNIIIWSLIGIILAFAAPHLGYFFVITALLELTTLLLVTVFSEKFKQKFDCPIGIFFPYMLPIIITMPMIVPVIMIASMVLKSLFIPLVMVLAMLMSGFITPYLALTKRYMDRLYKKLPKITRRVQKEVTETLEDKAKKGKFVTKTSIKVVKEKYSFRYSHAIGAGVLAFVFSIMAIVFSSLGFSLGYNFGGYGDYRNAVNNSSMVLVWEKVDNSSESTYLSVSDFMAYKYISDVVGGFDWSFSKNAYTKNVYGTSSVISSGPSVSVSGDEYSFNVYQAERSLVSLKLTNASSITKVIITANSGESFEYENDEASTIQINLPYKFGSFKMTVEGTDGITFEYTESIMDIGSSIANLAELDEWKDVMAHYAGNEQITNNLNSGIVFKITRTIKY